MPSKLQSLAGEIPPVVIIFKWDVLTIARTDNAKDGILNLVVSTLQSVRVRLGTRILAVRSLTAVTVWILVTAGRTHRSSMVRWFVFLAPTHFRIPGSWVLRSHVANGFTNPMQKSSSLPQSLVPTSWTKQYYVAKGADPKTERVLVFLSLGAGLWSPGRCVLWACCWRSVCLVSCFFPGLCGLWTNFSFLFTFWLTKRNSMQTRSLQGRRATRHEIWLG